MANEHAYTIHHTDAAKLYLDQAMELIGKAMKQTKDARTKDMLPKKAATDLIKDMERIHDELGDMLREF